MIRVLITEDSRLSSEFIKMILNSDSEIQVVGLAKDGRECIEKTRLLRPDVITMDIHMPVMNGLEATEYIMENIPTSILVVSSLVKSELDIGFNALKAGALDVIEKPRQKEGVPLQIIGEELIRGVKTVAKFRPFKRISKYRDISIDKMKKKADIPFKKDNDIKNIGEKSPDRVLVIGASTGGPPVLNYILKEISPLFPFPVVITQHIAHGFVNGLIEWLQKNCPLKIKVGKDNEDIRKGFVYFAPDYHHLGITKHRKMFLSNTPPILGHRPSIDFLMESAALTYKDKCLGIVLTGMGNDGANGMMAIRKAGGVTISQNEESSAIFGMPKAAIENGASTKVCSVEEIPLEINKWGITKN